MSRSRILSDFVRQVPGQIARILLLQVLPSPILSGDHFAAGPGSALTFHLVGIIVSGRPIVSQLFTGLYISQGYKHNLPLNADVRLAGVIAEDQAAFSFGLSQRTYEEIFRDLNLGRAKPLGHFLKSPAVEYGPAFDTNDFVFCDWL